MGRARYTEFMTLPWAQARRQDTPTDQSSNALAQSAHQPQAGPAPTTRGCRDAPRLGSPRSRQCASDCPRHGPSPCPAVAACSDERGAHDTRSGGSCARPSVHVNWPHTAGLRPAPSNGQRQNPASQPESDDRRSPKEAPSTQPFLLSYPWSWVIYLIGRSGVQPKPYRRTSVASQQPARASPELRKAPLSQRAPRIYTTPWGTAASAPAIRLNSPSPQ